MTLPLPTGVILSVLLGVLGAACAPIAAVHGNFVDSDRLAALQPGLSQKADVASILGSPSTIGTFNDDTWYYIGENTEKRGIFRPEVVARKIVRIQFDERGTMREVQTLDESAGESVALSDRETPTAGRDMTFIEQMLGNVGRFSNKAPKRNPGQPDGP